MKRRSLLAAMLGACAAPAYVKAGILMPVRKIVVPDSFGQRGWIRIPGYERYDGHVGLTQAEQMALNREFRRMLDNVPPRFQTVVGGERRHDLSALLNTAWRTP